MFYNKKLVATKLRRWEKYLNNYNLPTWEEFPEFELYMDQVVALLIKYLDFLPHDDTGEDKIVTPVAINNYVRMKIMPAPVKKKYSKIHLAYLIMICSLKQTLNISYISKMIPYGIAEDEVRRVYNDYVETHKKAARYFTDQVRHRARPVLDDDCEVENPVGKMLSEVAVLASFNRLLVEKIISLQGIESLPQDELE